MIVSFFPIRGKILPLPRISKAPAILAGNTGTLALETKRPMPFCGSPSLPVSVMYLQEKQVVVLLKKVLVKLTSRF